MQITFNTHCDARVPKLIRILPSIDNALITFSKPIFEAYDPSSIMSIIKSVSWSSILKTSFNVLRKSEVLGSGSSYQMKQKLRMENNREQDENTNKTLFGRIRGLFGSVISVFDTIIGYFSNMLHIILNIERNPEGNRFLWGLFAFFSGIASAFSIIMNMQIKTGTFSSISLCILQFISHIISAFIDLLYGVINGTLVLMNGDIYDAAEIIEEPLVPLMRQNSHSGFVVVSNNCVLVGNDEYPFDHIESLKRDGKTIEIKLTNGKQIPVEFDDDEAADSFYDTVTLEQIKDEE